MKIEAIGEGRPDRGVLDQCGRDFDIIIPHYRAGRCHFCDLNRFERLQLEILRPEVDRGLGKMKKIGSHLL